MTAAAPGALDPQASPAPAPPSQGLHLRDYVARVRDRWVTAALAFVLVCGGFVALGLFGEPVYESAATIQVEDPKSGRIDMLDDLALLEGRSSAEAEIEVMASHTVARGAVALAGLEAVALERNAYRPLDSLLRTVGWRDAECRLEARASAVPETAEGLYEVVVTANGAQAEVRVVDADASAAGGPRATDGTFPITVGETPVVLAVVSGDPAGRTFRLSLRGAESAARWVQENVVARQVGARTGIVTLGFQAPSPHLARRVAQAVADSYLAQKQTRKKLQLDKRLQWLGEQRQRFEGQLQAAEKRLDAYVTAEGAVLLSERARSVFEEQGKLTAQRLEQEQVLHALEAAKTALERAATTSETLVVLGPARTDATAVTLSARLAEYEVEMGALQRQGRSKEHPEFQRLEAAVAETRARLETQTRALQVQGLAVAGREIEAVKGRIAGIDKEHARLEARLATLPAEERRIAELTRDVESNSKALELIVRWEKESEIARESALASAYQVDAALLPLYRARPRLVRQGLLGVLLGLVAAVGLAFFLHYFDRTIRTPQALEQRLGLPLFAAIPDFRTVPRAERRGLGRTALPTVALPGSVISEAYRTLRANLRFAALDRPVKCLAITSSVQQEGKTVTTLNLAVAMAQAGARVLVVDADLRRPSAHTYLGGTLAPGLADVLARGRSWRETKRSTQVPGLDLLPAGTPSAQPAALLDSPAFVTMLDELVGAYDYVLFDVPPVLAVSDAAAFLRRLDAVLILARYGRCPAEVVEAARAQIRRLGGNVVGCVFNAFDARRAARGGYGAYGYYGSYGAPAETPVPGPSGGEAETARRAP